MKNIERQVVVIMGFGGGDRELERHAILDVMRIKRIVEQKVKVEPQGRSPGRRLSYHVGVFRAPTGSIPDDALASIDRADVLVALITEQNVNVIYELAIRNLLHDELIMIVRGDYRKILPIYLHTLAHIKYAPDEPAGDQASLEALIDRQIKATANAPEPPLQWNALHEIPTDVSRLIDENDYRLTSELQSALQKMEDGPPQRPAFLRNLVRDLDPGRLLSSWTTYGPYSVVRIKWRQKSLPEKYLPEDIDGKVVVYSANEAYCRLFDFAVAPFPDPDGNDPLTIERLLAQVKSYIDRERFEEFRVDQARATQLIVFEDRFGRAKVPLHFNAAHPSYANKVLLPQLIAKRVVGDTSAPHTTYLLISFVEIWPRMSEGTLQ